MHQKNSNVLLRGILTNYGMVLVLLLLSVLFSAFTLKEQSPTGMDAGVQVAKKILSQHRNTAKVLVITRNIAEDRLFASAVEKSLNDAGINVLETVQGNAGDARRAIEELLRTGETIDAIAVVPATAQWTIYDQFPEVGREKLIVPTSYTWPVFLKVSNLLGVANQTAIYAIIAIGMTMVIITGGIDLSVGSLVALAAVSSAMIIRGNAGNDATVSITLVASFAGIANCGIAGAFTGFMVTKFKLPAFIVTLGIMMMASGLAFRLSDGRSIPELPQSFFWIGGGQTFGIPNPVLLMLVLYVIAHVVMSKTVFGRYVYAIGGNEKAARLSGVPVNRILLSVYTICGLLAGLGGVVLASQLAAGDPKFGLMYELEVIAAVVVGGTSLMGGSGKIFGTLIGAFIIAVIKNGMNLTNVDPFNQKIVLGAVLLSAVLLDTLKRRTSDS